MKKKDTAILDYNQFSINLGSDSVVGNLFEGLVAGEKRHFGEYDNENNNVEKFGDSLPWRNRSWRTTAKSEHWKDWKEMR
uniref:Uncharacterized protein n=1 Tax=Candidatus Kentrum sp. LFY TaxID=2126342 RepID=A0A450UBR6_9GAMM|nr:MAG: hypothetical protein BECKLFY1418B_GA0070995_101627 [Candidatus Kentron sp. LFY]